MSTASLHGDRLKSLLLVCLMAAGEAMEREPLLARFVEYQDLPDEEEARTRFDAAVEAHVEAKAVRIEGDAIALEDEGRAQALAFLGYSSEDELPEKEGIAKVFLATGPLGLRKPDERELKRFSGVDGLRAVILRKHYKLEIDEYPSLPQVRDALTWWAIGDRFGRSYDHGSTERLGNEAVARAILSSLVEAEREYEPRSSLALLAAKVVGARSSDHEELERAVINRWLNDLAEVDPANLDAFVGTLHEVARTTKSGRFGANKVFISHVFRELNRRGGMNLPRETFDRCLIEAHTQDHVTLSRADLVEAMDPEDVRESEVQHQNSRFHFVRI